MTGTLLSRLLLLTLLTSISIVQTVSAQSDDSKKKFDSVYYFIATTLSAENNQLAIAKADSLKNHASDSLQKVRSLMLLATVHKRKGNYSEALHNAVQAEKLAGTIDNKEWQIRVAGFLSTSFRELGLTVEGKKYIDIAGKLNNVADASPLMNMFIQQENAYYAIHKQNYTGALAHIGQAITLLSGTNSGPGISIFSATNYQLMGYCYMRLDSLAEAEVNLHKALHLLDSQQSELRGFIYQNLGELSLKQHRHKLAIQYLDSAYHYIETSDNFNLKKNTYRSLKDYYQEQGNNSKAIEFQTKYMELVEANTALTKKVSNELIQKFDYELAVNADKKRALYYICGALILGIVSILIFSARLRKQERKKYLAYIEKLEATKLKKSLAVVVSGGEEVQIENHKTADLNEELPDKAKQHIETEIQPATSATEEMQADNDKREGLGIAKETELRILQGLQEMEAQTFYLQKEMTLAHLSAALKTNAKYLSFIINRHKGKDFSNYINELRINYIIHKLQQDPAYLDFKIAHLSQECGFSSHSKFTAAFKSITGLAPSTFINNIKKDNTSL